VPPLGPDGDRAPVGEARPAGGGSPGASPSAVERLRTKPLGEPPGPFPWRDFLAPRHWPTWLGFGLFAALARLPFDTQLAIGRGLGALLHRALPARRRVARINVDLAFPDLGEGERGALVRESFREAGAAVAETAQMWFRPYRSIAERVVLDGAERVDALLGAGRGVIMLQAHFTTLDVCIPAICARWPAGAVQDAPKNPLYAAFLSWQRARWIDPLVDNRDIRSMVRHLRRGGLVWYSPDQSVPASRGGVPTRYFGQPVLTTVGTARIAAMTGAAIVPHVPVREREPNRYTLRFLPPVELPPEDLTAATQIVNDLLERQVRERPEQYFWMHRRFKPPSSDLPDPYRRDA